MTNPEPGVRNTTWFGTVFLDLTCSPTTWFSVKLHSTKNSRQNTVCLSTAASVIQKTIGSHGPRLWPTTGKISKPCSTPFIFLLKLLLNAYHYRIGMIQTLPIRLDSRPAR